MKSRLLILLLASIAISFTVAAQTGNAPIIKNQIKINTDGLKVLKASLTDENGKELTLNQTQLNKPIYLYLEVNGWDINDGMVNLGASEKILTDKNTLVLYEDDLFPGKKDYKAEDARYISLKAIITSLTGEIKFFTVKFRVWDKNTGDNITGSYTFNIVK